MMLSIIIPTLNEEDYISDTLDCLAKQTYKDFEVIVVDGNSNDRTQQIVQNYKKIKDLKLINAKQKGVGLQRNLGEKYAKYEHLIFVDADDYLEDNFLEKIVDFLLQNPGIDIMTTWIEPISTKKIDKIIFFTYNQFYLDLLKRFKPQGGGAFIYIKKEVFNDLSGFNEKFYLAEDHDLFMRAHKQGYKYKLLKNPRIKTSIRRLEKIGRLRYIWTIGKGAVYLHFVGPFDRSNILDYMMDQGGAMYKGIKNKIKH